MRRRPWHSAFLEGVAKMGNITAAAFACGVSRATVYKALKHRAFEAECLDALMQFSDSLHLSVLAISKDPATPPNTRLSALQILLARSDRMIDSRGAERRPMNVAGENVLVINVDETTAKTLFERPAWSLPSSSGNGSKAHDLNGAGRPLCENGLTKVDGNGHS